MTSFLDGLTSNTFVRMGDSPSIYGFVVKIFVGLHGRIK